MEMYVVLLNVLKQRGKAFDLSLPGQKPGEFVTPGLGSGPCLGSSRGSCAGRGSDPAHSRELDSKHDVHYSGSLN